MLSARHFAPWVVHLEGARSKSTARSAHFGYAVTVERRTRSAIERSDPRDWALAVAQIPGALLERSPWEELPLRFWI